VITFSFIINLILIKRKSSLYNLCSLVVLLRLWRINEIIFGNKKDVNELNTKVDNSIEIDMSMQEDTKEQKLDTDKIIKN
jgi:hypothetical protein